jgi:hypothetical protein
MRRTRSTAATLDVILVDSGTPAHEGPLASRQDVRPGSRPLQAPQSEGHRGTIGESRVGSATWDSAFSGPDRRRELHRKAEYFWCMSKSSPTRQGPLQPKARKNSVVVEDPWRDSIVMTADEADLSGIRMLEEAAKARDNEPKGERDD